LNSKHTFSFADYNDPSHMGFGPLRVINEDIVAPGQGFGSHSHRDMEIITYVLDGTIAHRDSLGTEKTIKAGEVQRMTAGSGIVHSEYNHSENAPVHFLQIWVIPQKSGLPPGYEQTALDLRPDEWSVVADSDGQGALKIHQDVQLLAAKISADHKLSYSPKRKSAWIQVVRGSLQIDGQKLTQGDGAAVTDEQKIELTAISDAEVLLFDLSKI
jgi:redox-sensitive bicupin YhaK (pirin superfamily)